MTTACPDRHEFAGRRVLVTGAASGIGAALTRRLLAHGAAVAAVDCNGAGLDDLQALARNDARGGRLWAAKLDVRDADAVTRVVAEAEQAVGPLDGLACVAGVLEMGEVVDLNDAQWAQCFAVNATGVFQVCRAVARGMRARGSGAIVNVSSNAARTPRAGMSAYAASKAAVTQFSRCLALELAPHGIRVNIVSPGSTDTAMQQAMWARGSSREAVVAGDPSRWRLGIPLGKIATPDEIADAVLYLLSSRASHITLHDLRVDGGATLDQ